jgi:saccharopine dehydrogenase-like NADP-dependent oxidoreductase
MRIAVVGLGAVGVRVARQLLALHPETDGPVEVTLVHRSLGRLTFARHDLGARVDVVEGGPADLGDDVDVVVLTMPTGVRASAEAALERGAHVVATCDDPTEVHGLLALDAEGRERGLSIVVGAAFAPGLSCVLARFAARRLDTLTEVHVASMGTGGPACARRHHRALSSAAVDYNEGAWQRRPGGSGRELVWFPEPVGGADCYRAGVPDPALLVPAFPGVRRVTSRLAATRRDRLTTWMPMLRPPHPEGLVGAVRVEVRGFVGGVADTVTVGSSAPPALAAGAVAATTALRAASGRLIRPGAGGLAEMVDDPAGWLAELGRRGVPTSLFEGADVPAADRDEPGAADTDRHGVGPTAAPSAVTPST